MKGHITQEITMLARAVASGGILFSALYILREIRNRVSSNPEDPQTLDQLWERYERGEISCDEYEALSRDLEE